MFFVEKINLYLDLICKNKSQVWFALCRERSETIAEGYKNIHDLVVNDRAQFQAFENIT